MNQVQSTPLQPNILLVESRDVVRAGWERFAESANSRLAVSLDEPGRLLQQLPRFCGNCRPCVVLLGDTGEVDKVDLIQQIKKQGSDSIAIIVFWSMRSSSTIMRTLAAGADGYLGEDLSERDFAQFVERFSRDPAAWKKSQLDRLVTPPVSAEELAAGISAREIQVLHLLSFGLQNKAIGAFLGISHETVKEHVTSILHKLGVNARTAAAVWAVTRGRGLGSLPEETAPLKNSDPT
jgi:DNA-binding NarL/FixJ family response regulator